jgi:hypothetical protein
MGTAFVTLLPHSADPLWYRVALLSICLPACALGGYFRSFSDNVTNSTQPA